MLVDLHEVYPRVKVRVQEEEEEEDDDHFPPPNDTEPSSLFVSLTESLSKQEKENQIINSPPSIPRISKAYVTTPPTKSLSASKAAGTVKKNEQIGKDTKSNAKVNSIPPPRAVLSSPDNDGMIGSRNKLNYERSAELKKRPAEQIKPGCQTHNHKNVNLKMKCPKTINVKQSPNAAQSSSKIKTQNRMQKEPLKPPVPVVQRLKKAQTGDGRKSTTTLGI